MRRFTGCIYMGLLVGGISLRPVAAKTPDNDTKPQAQLKIRETQSSLWEIGDREKRGEKKVDSNRSSHLLTSQLPRWVKTVPSSSIVEIAQLDHTPRTLKEAGFPTQPISASSNPLFQTSAPVTPIAQEASTTPKLQVSPRVGGSFTTGPGVGYNSSFGGIEGFVPLSQSPRRNLAFLQGRALLSTEQARLGGNLVVGYRAYSPKSNQILGGYLGYDIRDTGNSTFHQVGVGVESLGDSIDFRANGYIPVGNTRHQTEKSIFNSSSFSSQTPSFQGNYLAIGTVTQIQQINRRFEAAMSGFDAEAGVKMARLGETGNLRGYGGLYYYDALGTAGIVGVRGRIEARPTDNFRVGLSVQSDGKFGTNVVLSVATNFPGTRPRGTRRQDEVVARLGEGVTRQENIVVDPQRESQVKSTGTSTIFATNPATNQPYFFEHVKLGVPGGNGTFENPFGAVANALLATRSDGNDIVYVQSGTNPGIPAFTIPNQVQVLSTGPVQQINTIQLGNIQLPLSGAGVLPTVTGTITLGNNNTLSGFAIAVSDDGNAATRNPGIGGTNISNPIIRDNTITSLDGDGIRLNNVTGQVTIANNTVTNSFRSGVTIDNRTGQVEFSIANNEIANNLLHGINIGLTGDSVVSTATVSNNTISDNGSQGIRIATGLTPDPTTVLTHTGKIQQLSILSNTVIGSRRSDGISIIGQSNIDTLTISNNTSSNNGRYGLSISTGLNAQIQVLIDELNIFTGNASDGVGLFPGIDSQLSVNAKFKILTGNNTQFKGQGDFNAEVEGNAVLRLQLNDSKIGVLNTSVDDNSTACLRLRNNQINTLSLVNDNAPDSTLQVEGTLPGTNTTGTITQNQSTPVSTGTCGFP